MHTNTSLRILLITHFLPPSHTAGTEQYTLGLGKALLSKGYDVHILCAEDWNTGRKYWNGVTDELYEGLVVHRVHLNWTKANNPNRVLYDSLPVEKWLDNFFATNKFDIVHVTSTYSLGVGVLRSAKRAKIPLLLTLMDYWFLCPSLQLLRGDSTLCDGRTTIWQCQSCLMTGSNLFQRLNKGSIPDSVNAQIWGTLAKVTQITQKRGFRGLLLDMGERKKVMVDTFNLPDLVISPSKVVQDMFLKNMQRPVELIPYGHDLSWLEEYSGKLRSKQIRFGYLGQIQKVKGVHLIVDAFNKADLGDSARLDIWGDYTSNTSYTNEMNCVIDKNPSIFLRGRYERKLLAKIMSEIDVLVVPSIWYENAPLVIQEAFATKTPVIATNLGGMSEAVFHETNGLLFSRGDVDNLSSQMKRIVNELGLLEQLVRGIPAVKSFEDELEDLEISYRNLIEKNDAH
jgi:glycosyltransferase involved in cell wall biosynthesis